MKEQLSEETLGEGFAFWAWYRERWEVIQWFVCDQERRIFWRNGWR